MSRRSGCSFIFLLALLLPHGVVDTAENPFWLCLGSSSYGTNSTFGHNMQRALAALIGNVSATDFYNVTLGESPDRVTAAGQCRGDLDGDACQACISIVASQVTQRCSPRNRITGYFTNSCVMYVGDVNYTIPPSFMDVSMQNPQRISEPRRFKPILTSFLNDLVVSATTNPSGHLYWGDYFNYNDNSTVYAMAQCIQSVSPRSCRSCLEEAVGLMLKDAADRTGGRVILHVECGLSFSTFPFFTPPPHRVAPSPSSSDSISSSCSPPTSSNMVGSLFHKNLKFLVTYLILYTPPSGFYNDTVGQGSSQVYGQALCRGDVAGDVCWHCVARASAKIQDLCPNSRRAVIWLDRCQLRYSDENFFGAVDVYDEACQPAAADITSTQKTTTFYENLRTLVSNLTSPATQSSLGSFFATGVSVLAESERIYALVQCVRDIPLEQCRWCLQIASSDIEGCLNGKQSGRILRGSCSLAFGSHPFFSGDPTLVLLPQPDHGYKHPWIIAVICFTGVLFLMAACVFCILRKRKQHLDELEQEGVISSNSENRGGKETGYDLPHISLKTVEDATRKFSESNKLGEGGYGPVYKGMLPDGRKVAVKRLSGRSRQGLKEFRNEVESMAKLQHTNLVRLIGCCIEKEEKVLVYEYMPNKSLDLFLKDPEGRELLNWEKRFDIITGIARGILYLHQDSRLNVIHRDLKASNILLDEQLNPKISDFGLARIFSGVHGQASTSVIVGTYGYMAPEYAMEGVFSTKSDVYSFGILLLETIGGRLNSPSICTIQDGRTLVEQAWSLWCEEKGREFIDPLILKDASASTSDRMLRCMHIGLLCTEEDAATRPAMSAVLLMLGNDSLDLPSPARPAAVGGNAAESSPPLSSAAGTAASGSTTG
ncbi:unnamed protein product [Victoria cruziana]